MISRHATTPWVAVVRRENRYSFDRLSFVSVRVCVCRHVPREVAGLCLPYLLFEHDKECGGVL
jgi:hypothetical protein